MDQGREAAQLSQEDILVLQQLAEVLREGRIDELKELLEYGRFLRMFREIKIWQTPLAEGIPLPARAFEGEDAGYDLRTAVDFTVAPGQDVKVPTGLVIDIPISDMLARGFVRIEQRTGNGGRGLIPGATVVDAGYRSDPEDEKGLTLWLRNIGTETLTFKKGDAVMQMLFKPVLAPTITAVGKDQINWDTKRGGGRFGSTGR